MPVQQIIGIGFLALGYVVAPVGFGILFLMGIVFTQ
jgi:hypothetical protein